MDHTFSTYTSTLTVKTEITYMFIIMFTTDITLYLLKSTIPIITIIVIISINTNTTINHRTIIDTI